MNILQKHLLEQVVNFMYCLFEFTDNLGVLLDWLHSSKVWRLRIPAMGQRSRVDSVILICGPYSCRCNLQDPGWKGLPSWGKWLIYDWLLLFISFFNVQGCSQSSLEKDVSSWVKCNYLLKKMVMENFCERRDIHICQEHTGMSSLVLILLIWSLVDLSGNRQICTCEHTSLKASVSISISSLHRNSLKQSYFSHFL